jgi:hypothetical protein
MDDSSVDEMLRGFIAAENAGEEAIAIGLFSAWTMIGLCQMAVQVMGRADPRAEALRELSRDLEECFADTPQAAALIDTSWRDIERTAKKR